MVAPCLAVRKNGVLFVNGTEHYQVGAKKGHKLVAITLPTDETGLLVASDTGCGGRGGVKENL